MGETSRPATPPSLTDAGLAGAVIMVTGGGSGIGAATARQLAAAGAPVVLAGRREGPLGEVAAEIISAGGQALCMPADLADPASPRRIVDACLARYGRLDGLVNNAAVVRHMPLGEWDTGCFDEHLAVNVRAPFFLIQAALPALRESPVRSVRRPGRGVPVAGQPGAARADRRPGGGGAVDHPAAEPAGLVHDRRGHPAGRRAGHRS